MSHPAPAFPVPNSAEGSTEGKSVDVVTFGETMALMKSTNPGPLAHETTLGLGIGGAESNTAIALRRLGATVAWAGRVGQDSLGELVLRQLRAEDLIVHVLQDPEAATGLMIKERRTSESTKVMYYRAGSAGSRLCPQDLPAELITGARILHITGITPALSASAAEAVSYAVQQARAAGTLVSFDLNYRQALWSKEDAAVTFKALIEQADVVFAGDDEAAIVVGEASDPLQLAARIAALGPAQVVIKLGAEGAVALVDGETFTQPAIPIRPVDTVGAGDAFVAGYLAELLLGEPVGTRLLTAAQTGAFACLVPGDWEGMPRRSELGLLTASEPVSR